MHIAMSSLTDLQHTSSEQHTDLGLSRKRRDNHDLSKIITWFDSHDPFDLSETALKSLSSGLVANDDINCDDADLVGEKIQKNLDNVTFEEAKIRKKDRIKTLEVLQPGVTVGAKTVNIDPLILFTRLTAIIQRDGSVIVAV